MSPAVLTPWAKVSIAPGTSIWMYVPCAAEGNVHAARTSSAHSIKTATLCIASTPKTAVMIPRYHCFTVEPGDFTSLRFSFAFLRLNECYRDLNEAAGAADATACSVGSCFRGSKSFSAPGGNMLLCQDFPF